MRVVTKDLEEFAKVLIEQGKEEKHPLIMKYLEDLGKLTGVVHIELPTPNLPKITDPDIGITTSRDFDPVIWKMSSFVYQYPSVCEHVPFHASMIMKGHGKLFINPRLIFTYGG